MKNRRKTEGLPKAKAMQPHGTPSARGTFSSGKPPTGQITDCENAVGAGDRTNGPFSGGVRRGNFFGERQNRRRTTERTHACATARHCAHRNSQASKSQPRGRTERSDIRQLSGEFRAAVQAMTQSASKHQQ